MGLLLQSFFQEFLLFLGSLLFIFYAWGRKKYRYFDGSGLPYLKPIFPFGSSFKQIIGIQYAGHFHKDIYDRFKGVKMGGFYQIFNPVITVRDPETIQRVMIQNFSHFHDRGIKIDEETNPLDGHLFSLSGEKWRVLRSKLSPIFTSGKLKWMFEQFDACSDSLVQIIEGETKETDGEIEVKDLMARFTTDVIGSSVFGLEPESIKNPNCPFREMGREIFDPGLKQVLVNIFRLSFPDLFLRLKIKTISKHVNDFFINLVQDMFKMRKSTGTTRNDFVQLLLQLKEKGSIEVDQKEAVDEDDEYLNKFRIEEKNHRGPEMKIEMTDDLLTAQAFVFFVAGFETSATALSFTIYLLSKNQEAQGKAREEVRGVKKKHGGKITYEALKEMTYLENCINESLRLYPPLAMHFRVCTKSIEMWGLTIHKGIKLIVSLLGLHMDPEIYKEPEKYRPERFQEGEGSTPGTFMPFGDGPRICIGKRFAMVEMKLALAKVLDVYSINLSPKFKEPVELKTRSFITQAKDGLWVKFKKISKE